MQIQPVQPVAVNLKCGRLCASCSLVELTDNEMQLTSTDYLDKDSPVVFTAKFFRGEAVIKHINFYHYRFTYTLSISTIKYQPGLLVNQQL
ncbi:MULTISPECIES: hypothetical protein [unclassified Legionella]|uniref:hypothetical protein n=1 Tax=unclassified Legionella TaxID=2622702 RepID=UPI0010560BE0|nr:MULTISPECIES: hypothetical protein [unclassified Legionella]MDI9819518.1 hypothetical protein [Legionella sp. PL877]